MNKVHHALLLLILCGISFIPFIWTSGNELLIGYDNVFPLRPVEYIQDRLYSWTRTRGVEMDHSGMQGSIIVHVIDSLPLLVGFSPHTGQKIVFSAWFFALLLSPYLFIRRLEQLQLLKSPLVRYIFPVLYAVNFYVLQAWWVAERTKFSLMVSLPLLLMIVVDVAMSRYSIQDVVRKSIYAAFILTVFNGGGWIGLPLYGGLFLGLAVAYIFFTTVHLHARDFIRIRNMTLLYVLFACWLVLFNAYTLLPFMFVTLQGFQSQLSTAGGVTGLLGWANYLSADTSIIHLLQMQGIPDWYNSIDTHPYASFYLRNNYMIVLSFVFPTILFLSFLAIKKNVERTTALFFMVLLLVSLVMTAGTHKPFGPLVTFMFTHIPGFIIFRSIFYKFGYIYWFAASFFIALGISAGITAVFDTTRSRIVSLFIKPVVIVSCIAALVVYHVPYVTGDFFRVSQNNESGRVTIPPYVDEFDAWWKEMHQTSKILLLPRLNKDWLFEQYRWGYVSLTPLLSNYAAGRILENVEHATPDEYELLTELYDAINARDTEKVDLMTQMLGVQYFLVRNDFYFDFPERETDDPSLINGDLRVNANVRQINEFGEWIVYEYTKPRPLIYASTDARTGTGIVQKPGEIILPIDEHGENADIITSVQVSPVCMSCSAEIADTSVIIPTLRILPDSPLYELSLLKNKLGQKPALRDEDRVFRHIGDSLKYIGYIDGLLKKESAERYIHTSAEQFVASLQSVNKLLPSVFEMSYNPYKTVIIARQYIEDERAFIRHLLRSSNKQSITIVLEKMMSAISETSMALKAFYSPDDFNIRKYYLASIVSPGIYTVALDLETLGTIDQEDISALSVSMDGQTSVNALSTQEGMVYFPSTELSEGQHRFLLQLPQQDSLLTGPVHETISERECFSYRAPFSKKKQYELVFNERNMFDPYFSISIDHGKLYDPRFALYFLLSAGDTKEHRYIVSEHTIPLDDKESTVRISFCAPWLTQQYFTDTIQHVVFRELVRPELMLSKNIVRPSVPVPDVQFEETDQTTYNVHIGQANGPFFLVLSERFAPGWTLSSGTHIVANHFANAWRIDEVEPGELKIYYKPQDYFIYGLIVSLTSFVMSLALLWVLRPKRT